MTLRGASAVAVSGWLLSVAAGVGAVLWLILSPDPILVNTFGVGPAGLVGFAVLGNTWALVGGLLLSRRPDNSVGRHMLAVGVAYSIASLMLAVTSSLVADGSPTALSLAPITAWTPGLAASVGGLLFSLGLIFPTGRGHTPGWHRVARIQLAALVIASFIVLTQPGPLTMFPSLQNPMGFGPDLRVLSGARVPTVVVAYVLYAAVFGPIIMAGFFARYRAAGHVERAQLRWFAASIALSLTGFAAIDLAALGLVGGVGEAALIAYTASGTTVPIAIGIAILRYRLYDIDRIVSRTIAYAAISATIGVIFAALLVSLSGLMATVAGGETIAAAASTLTAYAFFQPVRRRVQRQVDRRFDRSRYDADATVRTFAGRLPHDVDIGAVCGEIVETASAAVRPVTAGVWLRERRPWA